MTFSSNIIALRPAGFGPMPRLIPDTLDKVLEQRWDARLMADHAYRNTGHCYTVVRRQADFERRLDAIARRRAKV